MKISNLILMVLVLSSFAFFGQKKNEKKFATTFRQFDVIRHTDSTVWQIQTDKIRFFKTGGPDTIRSKPYLDSLCWFLSRHPYAIVEILLKKNDTFGGEYRHTRLAQLQTQQMADYLIKRHIEEQRILGNVIVCGSPMIADEKIEKTKPKKTYVIVTSIRVISEDFKDPNAK